MSELDPGTAAGLDRLALDKQIADRLPGLAAGVGRSGDLAWFGGVGSADLTEPDREPDADTQYAIASNTKTFVAVVVMALRDEGRLDLGDRLDQHVPEAAHGDVTIRQLLAHSSGMQREPVGDVWERMAFPGPDELVGNWDQLERVGRPHDRWHYSNMGFAMLGEVVSRLDGGDWFASVHRRILEPLEMSRTGLSFGGRRARGYFVPPYSDVAVAEDDLDLAGVAAAGAMVSTVEDMVTWGGFWADPPAEVLAADTVEEICQPQVIADVDAWQLAYGLGVQLLRRSGRTWVGHTGGFPGFISGVMTDRGTGTTGVVLTNSGTTLLPARFAATLGSYADEHAPALPEPWRPGTSVPTDLEPLLGTWFGEGRPHTFSVHAGVLEARDERTPDDPPSRFEPIGTDEYRTVTGPERGERLVVHRDAGGDVVRLTWATYRFTREPLAFRD